MSVAEDFFDMFAIFTQVKSLSNILQRVVDSMVESDPLDPFTLICYVKQPLVAIDPTSPDFPKAIGSSIDRLKESMERTKKKAELSEKAKAWIESILVQDGPDPGIATVLRYTLRKLE